MIGLTIGSPTTDLYSPIGFADVPPPLAGNSRITRHAEVAKHSEDVMAMFLTELV